MFAAVSAPAISGGGQCDLWGVLLWRKACVHNIDSKWFKIQTMFMFYHVLCLIVIYSVFMRSSRVLILIQICHDLPVKPLSWREAWAQFLCEAWLAYLVKVGYSRWAKGAGGWLFNLGWWLCGFVDTVNLEKKIEKRAHMSPQMLTPTPSLSTFSRIRSISGFQGLTKRWTQTNLLSVLPWVWKRLNDANWNLCR